MSIGGKHIDFIIEILILIFKFGLLSLCFTIIYSLIFRKIKNNFVTTLKAHLLLFGFLFLLVFFIQLFGLIIHGFTPPELIKQIIWSLIVMLILIIQLWLCSLLFLTSYSSLPNGKLLLLFTQLFYSIIFIVVFVKLFPSKML